MAPKFAALLNSKPKEPAAQDTGGHPSRKAKDKALNNKVWVGAAPTGGSKASAHNRDDESEPEEEEDFSPPPKKKRTTGPKGSSHVPIVVQTLKESTGSKQPKSRSRKQSASGEDSADESQSSPDSPRTSSTASSTSDVDEEVESRPKQPIRGRPVEAMVPLRNKRKADKSPSATRDNVPPSTDMDFSDGNPMDVDDDDDEEEQPSRPLRQRHAQKEPTKDIKAPDAQIPKRPRTDAPEHASKKDKKMDGPKKDSARDRKYRAEQPDASSKPPTAVKDMKPPKKKPSKSTTNEPEDTKPGVGPKSESKENPAALEWPASTDLVITKGCRILSKRRQTTEIQAILDEAIENTLALFFFKDIYPDSAVQTKFCRDAVALATRNNDLAELIDRMAKDRRGYGKYFDEYVMNRVVNVRKETREQAGKVVAPAYGLLTLHRSTLKELTTELRKRDRSVYPLTVPDDYKTIDRSRPFQHAAVIQTLRLAFFTGSKSHHIVYKDCFSSSIPEKPDELEVPEPMLILSVCAVHATLGDYITGEYIHPEGSIGAFTADAARAPYLACKVLLDKIRVQPAKYHALMHGLYLRVVPASTATHGNTSDSDESDVDLDNMADDAEGYTTNDAGAGGGFAFDDVEDVDVGKKQDDKQDTAQSGMDEK